MVIVGLAIMLGTLAGGGSAMLVAWAAPTGSPQGAPPVVKSVDLAWIALEPLTIPVTTGEGAFMGYMTVKAQVQLASADAEPARKLLPHTLHAINMVVWRSPLGLSERTGALDIALLRTIILKAARQTLGAEVKAVAVTGVEAA